MQQELVIIRDALKNHKGKDNKITSSQIAKLIKIKDNKEHTRTRDLILKAAKKYKLPLGANNRGYFLINSKEEYQRYINNLDSRIKSIRERKKIVTNNYQKQE